MSPALYWGRVVRNLLHTFVRSILCIYEARLIYIYRISKTQFVKAVLNNTRYTLVVFFVWMICTEGSEGVCVGIRVYRVDG